MRFWVRDDRRRPDPVVVRTDDQVPILVGTGLWAVGFVVIAVVAPIEHRTWLLVTCVIGVVLGVIGLIYTRARQRNGRR